MTATLSSKGQVVLPKQVRMSLRLRAGSKLSCRVEGESIVLTPERGSREHFELVTDARTGLRITQSAPNAQVTSEDVRAAMAGFP